MISVREFDMLFELEGNFLFKGNYGSEEFL